MKFSFVFVFLLAAVISSQAWAQSGPNRPEAKPVTLDSKSTAALVLDLSARCQDAKQVCSKLMAPLGAFLEKARAANVPILFSVSAAAKGTPLGQVAAPLKRKENETVIYPNAFDKFVGGALQAWLKDKGAKTLIITGSSSNVAVLYTATTAARMHRDHIVIPTDGINANTPYEEEYSLHQFTVLPNRANKLFQFTKLSMITFH